MSSIRRPRYRNARRDTRGATITEYAIILFLVAVVGALAFRFLGDKLSGGVGKAGSNLDSPAPAAAQADSSGTAGGGGGLTTSHGANGGTAGGGDPNASYGGPRTAATPQEGTPFAKFAMIALGIIGAGAAFFAAMKGKHAR
jgi:Flp pilus assembly pilin Flp